jgi:hypothetical protein
MDMPIDKVVHIQKISQETASLDTSVGDDDDDSKLEDFIEDVKNLPPDKSAARQLLKDYVTDSMLKTSDFDFNLPENLIAQTPFFPKEKTKMLVCKNGEFLDRQLTNLGEEFEIFVAVGEQDGPQDLQKKLEDWQADHDRAALTILQLKHLHRSIRPNQDIQAVLEIARLYQRIRPDIVHLNSTKAGIIGSFAKFGLWFRRAAVVYTVHGWVFNEPLHDKVRWLYAWLEKVTARCKDKIIVLSKPDKDSGTRVLQVSENCFTVIPLGIDTPTPAWSSTKAREVH